MGYNMKFVHYADGSYAIFSVIIPHTDIVNAVDKGNPDAAGFVYVKNIKGKNRFQFCRESETLKIGSAKVAEFLPEIDRNFDLYKTSWRGMDGYCMVTDGIKLGRLTPIKPNFKPKYKKFESMYDGAKIEITNAPDDSIPMVFFWGEG